MRSPLPAIIKVEKKLSKYKFKKLAAESLKNGLRLHFDSILLYRNGSYPSAVQLSVLALEEIAKSYWIEHYYYSSITNEGFPDEELEQKWLKLLYIHTKKHEAFIGWNWESQYHQNFVDYIRNGELDKIKQKATYVGLEREKKKVAVDGRISSPFQIKPSDARKLISVLNDHLIDRCDMKEFYGNAYEISEKDSVLSELVVLKLNTWGHRSGLRKEPMFKARIKKSKRKKPANS